MASWHAERGFYEAAYLNYCRWFYNGREGISNRKRESPDCFASDFRNCIEALQKAWEKLFTIQVMEYRQRQGVWERDKDEVQLETRCKRL